MIVLGCIGLLLLFAAVFNLQTVLASLRRLTRWLTPAGSRRRLRGHKVARNRVAYAFRKAPAER